MYTGNQDKAKAGKSLKCEAASVMTTTSVSLLGLQTDQEEVLASLQLVALEISIPSGKSLPSTALFIPQ